MHAALLGEVTQTGHVYFEGDLQECRTFLMEAGLHIDRSQGWVGSGKAGKISYDVQKGWTATWWRT